MRNINQTRSQKGFTLTELMISIMLGMSVISSVLIGYLATYSGSVSTLASSKLSLEMTTLMNVMIEDIRRAGYNGNSVGAVATSNPFSQFNNTALEVFDRATNAQSLISGNCIVYSYDRNGLGDVTPSELFGFRLNGDTVEMRQNGDVADADTCGVDADWEELTDPAFMDVGQLTFDISPSACLNTSEPDGQEDGGNGGTIDDLPEFNCNTTTPDTGDFTVDTREVLITLSASLTEDSFVLMTMTQRVRVRNDMVRKY